MRELLEEIQENLSALLQSGFASVPPAVTVRLKNLGGQCEDTGLHTGAQLLGDLAAQLENRSHAIQKDDTALMDTVCRAVRYVQLCTQRMNTIYVTRRWENPPEQEE